MGEMSLQERPQPDETNIIEAPSAAAVPTPVSADLTPLTFAPLLKKLVTAPDTFTLPDLSRAFEHLAVPNATDPAQVGAFLATLHILKKDHDPDVVAACAEVMGRHSLPVEVGNHGEGPVCDIVGTGGDGHNTFNVSTTAGIVAAGAGCRVYKHGNKAATSSSGSADILMSLGCPVTLLPPSSIGDITPITPFLFLFAPNYHPAMVRVAPIRRSIAFPTVFNTLGPLINPAKPKCMIVGVHSKYLGPIFVQALKITGVDRAWVVCGEEGLDEISPAGITNVWDLNHGVVTERTVSPTDFGLPSNSLASVAGSSPAANASLLVSLLDGQIPTSHPVENFVVLNAAALLYLAGKVETLKEGVAAARSSIKDGKAKKALEAFRIASSAEVDKVGVVSP